MTKSLTLKQVKWVEETAATLNPTEAVRRVYQVKNNKTAKSMASENLAKPYLREALEFKLLEQGLTDQFVLGEHRKVIRQNSSFSAKNGAIDMFYRLRGWYAPSKQLSLNVDIPLTEEELNKEIDKLAQELKSLNSHEGEG